MRLSLFAFFSLALVSFPHKASALYVCDPVTGQGCNGGAITGPSSDQQKGVKTDKSSKEAKSLIKGDCYKRVGDSYKLIHKGVCAPEEKGKGLVTR